MMQSPIRPVPTTAPDIVSEVEDAYTSRDLIRICRVGPATISRWLASGKLPSIKAGNRVLVARNALAAFLEAGRRTRATTGRPATRSRAHCGGTDPAVGQHASAGP
jgi:excisionase family DNA binding protein